MIAQASPTQSDILAAIRRVKPQFPGARFILFGSRAREAETVRPDSDLDVYVVFLRLEEPPLDATVRVSKALHAVLELAMDIVVADETWFRERSTRTWTLEGVVAREGMVV